MENKNFARDALGFVPFFTIKAKLRRENALFHDLSGRKQPLRQNFPFHSELGYGSYEFNSGRVPLPENFSKRRFYCRRRRDILRFLIYRGRGSTRHELPNIHKPVTFELAKCS